MERGAIGCGLWSIEEEYLDLEDRCQENRGVMLLITSAPYPIGQSIIGPEDGDDDDEPSHSTVEEPGPPMGEAPSQTV